MMWSLLFLVLLAHIQLGNLVSHRLFLRGGQGPCHGYVEVYYKNERGYVGDKDWSANTEQVVCRSTRCGVPVETTNTERPQDGRVLLNELNCKGNEDSLDKCLFPGWGISDYQKLTVKKIKCSNQIKISLADYRCAGAVQYEMDGKKGYFCRDNNWKKEQANLVCQSLGCGDAEEIPAEDWRQYEKQSSYMKIDCRGIRDPEHLWQCVTTEAECQYPATVKCKNFQRLQLTGNSSNACSGRLEKWQTDSFSLYPLNKNKNVTESFANEKCKQMNCGSSVSAELVGQGLEIKCSDQVKVVLKDKAVESRCYGAVYIKKNKNIQPVCASSVRNQKTAEIVCRELNCGEVIEFSQRAATSGDAGIMDNVNCSGKESSIWHCLANHGKRTTCQNYPYVVCSDSVNAELVDGPGRCAGRLAITHEGQQKRVAANEWDDAKSDLICRQLKCGSSRSWSSATFMSGSGSFLTVTCNGNEEKRNISACKILNSNILRDNDKLAVGIICEEHKVVFLQENCYGKVGIQKGSDTFWLSGSNTTWNKATADTVCEQIHCGVAESFTSVLNSSMEENVWDRLYSCSSPGRDLFECDDVTTSLPSDYNETIAYVTCTGKITMSLSNGCYGHVKFCAQNQCGGVCSDAWTEEMSEMMCQQLGCGDKVLPSKFPDKNIQVLFKSVHTLQNTDHNLTECTFVMDNRTNCKSAYVVCSASIKPRFSASRDKCAGNVEVEYEGRWLPLCTQTTNERNTVCKELGCGVLNETLKYLGPTPSDNQIRVQCTAKTTSLKECSVAPKNIGCRFVGLQCSEWSTMAVEEDENNACKGHVFIRSKGKTHAVSSEGWTQNDKQQFCQDMNCGNVVLKNSNQVQTRTGEKIDLWKTKFNCIGKTESVQECKNYTQPQKKDLHIECDGESKSKITLSNGCHGEFRIGGVPVCGQDWTREDSHKVCQQKNCGNAISESLNVPISEAYYTQCDSHHYKLDQCKREKGTCPAGLVSITCYKSLQFNTTEKCGGELKVLYNGAWTNVCDQPDMDEKFKRKLCKSLKCTDFKRDIPPKRRIQGTSQLKLNCTDAVMDVKYCVQQQQCQSSVAEIYCEGYVKIGGPKQVTNTPTVPIIVGVLLLLVLVILIIVFIRFFLKKGRKSSRMLPGKDEFEEFESGDYEAVESKSNEVEDFDPGTFRPEAEFISENDAQSATSLPYDDIDEMTEAQPLNTPGSTAASRDSYMNEPSLNQSTDGVEYEGEDPQENYDDIEAGPEVTQTEAEVHDGPNIPAEGEAAAAPPDLVQGDDDYLVPGEDG